MTYINIFLSNFHWWIIILCLVGFLCTFGIKVKSNNKKFLLFYFILHLLLFTFLGLLALKPAIKTEEEKFNTVVLSENFNEVDLVKLKKNDQNKHFFYFDPEKISPPDTIGTLLSIDSILNKSDTVFLLGQILPSSEFSFLDKTTISHFPSKKSDSGITNISYTENCALGESCFVTGIYSNNNNNGDTLVFKDYLGVAQQFIVPADSTKAFNFKTTCKTAGLFENTLTVNKDLNLKTEYILPLEIFPSENISVCIVGGFPTFENKFLKDYLAEQGHSIYNRLQISKNKHREEFINQASFQFNGMTNKFLNKIDLLICDVSSLSEFPESEKQNLYKAVKNGLGLFILDENKLPVYQNKNLLPFEYIVNSGSTEEIEIGTNTVSLESISHHIKKGKGTNALLTSKSNKIIAVYKNIGIGKIALMLYSSTYELKLKGDDKVYKTLWKNIFQKIIKSKVKTAFWTSLNQPTLANHRSDLLFVTDERTPVGIIETPSKNKTEIYLAQNFHITEKWKGRYFFEESGWHYLYTKKDTLNKQALYVQDASKWAKLLDFQNEEKFKDWLAKKAQNITKASENHFYKALPSWWFFLGIVFAYVIIWWLEKRGTR